jgi:hypothetical protein
MSKNVMTIEQYEQALRVLEQRERAYADMIGMANVNPFFALGIIASLRERIDNGERSRSLYDDIMNMK